MEEKLRKCGACGSYYTPAQMSIKQRLFRRPTWNEWLTLFMMLMIIIAAFTYQRDTKVCREYIKSQQQIKINLTEESNPVLIFNSTLNNGTTTEKETG